MNIQKYDWSTSPSWNKIACSQAKDQARGSQLALDLRADGGVDHGLNLRELPRMNKLVRVRLPTGFGLLALLYTDGRRQAANGRGLGSSQGCRVSRRAATRCGSHSRPPIAHGNEQSSWSVVAGASSHTHWLAPSFVARSARCEKHPVRNQSS